MDEIVVVRLSPMMKAIVYKRNNEVYSYRLLFWNEINNEGANLLIAKKNKEIEYSNRIISKRFKQYPKGSELVKYATVKDRHMSESLMIDDFKKHFIHRRI